MCDRPFCCAGSLATIERREYRTELPPHAASSVVRNAAPHVVQRAAEIPARTFFRDRTDRAGRPRLVAPTAWPPADVRSEFSRVVFPHPPGVPRRRLRTRVGVLRLARSGGGIIAGILGGAFCGRDVCLDADRVRD